MGEIAKLATHFVLRDAVYALSGSLLLSSVFYSAGRLRPELEVLASMPAVAQWVVLGVAWAVGYGVSDSLGLLAGVFKQRSPLVPSYHILRAGRPTRALYRAFVGFRANPGHAIQWTDVHPTMAGRLSDAMDERIKQPFGPYHRTVMLRHLGSSVGQCGVIASVVTLVGTCWTGDRFVIVLATLGLLLATALWILGWVKALQQTASVVRARPWLFAAVNEPPTSASTEEPS